MKHVPSPELWPFPIVKQHSKIKSHQEGWEHHLGMWHICAKQGKGPAPE